MHVALADTYRGMCPVIGTAPWQRAGGTRAPSVAFPSSRLGPRPPAAVDCPVLFLSFSHLDVSGALSAVTLVTVKETALPPLWYVSFSVFGLSGVFLRLTEVVWVWGGRRVSPSPGLLEACDSRPCWR